MDEYVLSSRFISKRFVCAAIYLKEGGAVLRFYIRYDFLHTHNGSCSVQRTMALGEIELKSDEFRPAKPSRLYDVTVEEAGCGGGRNEL